MTTADAEVISTFRGYRGDMALLGPYYPIKKGSTDHEGLIVFNGPTVLSPKGRSFTSFPL